MKKNEVSRIKKVFYILLGIFLLIVAFFAVPTPDTVKRALFPFAAVLSLIFCISGILLVYFTLKSKLEKKLRYFLILTGACAALFLPSVLLHNFVYALMVYIRGPGFTGDEAFFFILALIVLPVLFLIGMIGSLILLIKKRR